MRRCEKCLEQGLAKGKLRVAVPCPHGEARPQSPKRVFPEDSQAGTIMLQSSAVGAMALGPPASYASIQ